MRKILGLTLTAIIVMALVGGGTWAYFSDVATSSANTFAAGTLDLGVANVSGNSTGSTGGTFTTPPNWAPGDNISAILYVNNAGSIAMSTVNVTFSHSGVVNGTPATVSAGPGGNTDNLTKMIIAESATWGGSNVAAITGNSLDTLIGAGAINLGSLAANTETQLYILWRFDTTATNGCQGDTDAVTLTINGNQ